MVRDHLDNIFENEQDMCKHWGVACRTYYYRKSKNLPLNDCLKRSKQLSRKPKDDIVIDHLGQTFRTINEMCDYWGINDAVFRRRQQRGKSLACSLTGIDNIYDPLGNKFKNIKEMREYWKVPYKTYSDRLKNGYSMEEALGIIPLIYNVKNLIVDEQLTILHGINAREKIYFSCILNGKDCIMMHDDIVNYYRKYILKSKHKSRNFVYDHEGKAFESVIEMCKYWKTDLKMYQNRVSRGYSIEESLGVINLIDKKTKDIHVDENLTILNYVSETYYLCMQNDEETIMTHDEIVNYYRKNILKTIV